MMMIEHNGQKFIAPNFIDAALLSAGQYHRKAYHVWSGNTAATIATDTVDKAHAIFNAAFKRGDTGAIIQAVTG